MPGDTYNFGPTVPALFAAHERRYQEAQTVITLRDEEIESLRQQLADSQKREVTLRDALEEIQMVAESSVKTHGYDKQHIRNADVAKRALAATELKEA